MYRSINYDHPFFSTCHLLVFTPHFPTLLSYNLFIYQSTKYWRLKNKWIKVDIGPLYEPKPKVGTSSIGLLSMGALLQTSLRSCWSCYCCYCMLLALHSTWMLLWVSVCVPQKRRSLLQQDDRKKNCAISPQSNFMPQISIIFQTDLVYIRELSPLELSLSAQTRVFAQWLTSFTKWTE